MDVITIAASPKTPYICADPVKGQIEIKGRSIPENSIEFYKPLVEWLELYGEQEMKTTQVKIQLEYFNTSSSKCVLDIFKRLEVMYRKGWNIEIYWYYDEDDEDMYESGVDYQSILTCPISLVEVKSL